MQNSTKCLVTGGAGFIGSATSHGLTKSFDEVVALDNLHPQVHTTRSRPSRLADPVKLLIEDVVEDSSWGFLQSFTPDVVIHLAAETGTGQSLAEASRHASVNVVGTARMLDNLVKHKALPKRIVLSSSRAVYGEGDWRNNATGELSSPGQRSRQQLERGIWDFPNSTCLPFVAGVTQAMPTSVYGATKCCQEQILSAWCQAYKVELVILRFQNVYGPGQSLTNPYTGIVPFFAQIARNKQQIPVYEDGKIIRDFVYISDVANSIIKAATHSGVLPNNLFDIGSGKATSILQLAEMIAKRYGAPPPKITGQFRDGDVRHATCRTENAQSVLGWRPQVDVEAGLSQLCDWIDEIKVNG